MRPMSYARSIGKASACCAKASTHLPGRARGRALLAMAQDCWGTPGRQIDGSCVQRQTFVPSPGRGYLVLTVEPHGEFDVWLETIEEVEAYVEELRVVCPSDR